MDTLVVGSGNGRGCFINLRPGLVNVPLVEDRGHTLTRGDSRTGLLRQTNPFPLARDRLCLPRWFRRLIKACPHIVGEVGDS